MLVGEIMTSPAVTVRDDSAPQVAVALLAHRRLTMLPVVDAEGRLVGVVSRSDIIRAMSRDDDDIRDDVNRLLRELGPGWEATVSKGVTTISGPGPDREGDAAASLAATVMGVRAIRMAQARRQAPAPGASPSAPDEWSVDARTSPVSSGTGADQL